MYESHSLRYDIVGFFSFALVILVGILIAMFSEVRVKRSLRKPVDYWKTKCLNRSLAGWQVLFTDGPVLCFRSGHFPRVHSVS